MASINNEDNVDARGNQQGNVPDAKGQSSLPRMLESDFESDRYNMSHSKRGLAVIINNVNFSSKTAMLKRAGSTVDATAMFQLLDTLKFKEIQQYDNLTVRQMKDALHKVSKMDHTDHDCFFCVILSHGEEGNVFGTDNKVPVDELVQPFKGNECPSLAGKPKLFFIQACRNDIINYGETVSDGAEEEVDIIRRIPAEADFLIAYSVVPGLYCWRKTSEGSHQSSWFIKAVVDIISRNWQTMDLMTMMTRVIKKVAYDFESNAMEDFKQQKKQIPCITSMLTKEVYFNK
uniref:Caspase family p20 domain-containing protein n=1 Tax=Arion vulgaris TaxID=1028688 RepID=A0A0B7BHR3_9EUPU